MPTKKTNSHRQFVALATSASLVAVSLVPAQTAQAQSPFTDVGDRYEKAVDYLVANNITDGITSTQFGTLDSIVRVDAAVLLAQALKAKINPADKSTFTDVPQRAQSHLAFLQKEGIVFGKTGTSFDSFNHITRGEVALILAEAFELEGNPKNLGFTDVSSRYEKAVAALLENGVTVGKTETSFGTEDPITRGEYAIFLYKLLTTVGTDPGNPGNPGDSIIPKPPAVNPVDNDDAVVTGKGEAGTDVTVTIGDKEYTGTVDKDGNFEVEVPVQETGTEIKVVVTDKAGNASDPTVVVVVDAPGTPETPDVPAAPAVDPVDNDDAVVTGKGEAGTDVTVTIGDKEYTGTVDKDDNFEVEVPVQETGTEIKVVVTDKAGNASDPTVVVVVDATGTPETPDAPAAPAVDPVDNDDAVVTGKGEAGTDVTVTIGDKEYTGTVDKEGNFEVEVPVQETGTEIKVVVTDKAGNASDPTVVVVVDATETPDVPAAPAVDPVDSDDAVITGTAEPSSTVTATVGNQEIGFVVAGEDGKFSIGISPQAASTIIDVTSTNEAGRKSEPTSVTVTEVTAGSDNSELEKLVDELTSNLIKEYFTNETWTNFDVALQEANKVLADNDATQPQIDKAYDNLKAGYEGLIYVEIPYTISDDVSASQITLTFTEAVALDGPIETVGGTVADATINVTNEGLSLTVSSPANAQPGDTVEATLPVGGKPVVTTLTWNGNSWTVDTDPKGVFVTTVPTDIGAVIDLSLVDNEGNLISGGINLDQLLNNPNLIRLSLLPSSGLVSGDVIKLGTPLFELLNVKLTEEDISRGFVDVGINSDLLKTLTGGETLDLEAIVTRNSIDVVNGVIGTLPLPTFLTKPVVESLSGIGEELAYILAGDSALRIDVPTLGVDRFKVGDQVVLELFRERLLLPNISETTAAYILTPEDIERGYIEYTFDDDNLILRLLSSLTVGSEIDITPIILDEEREVRGETQTATISQGILSILLRLIGDLILP
ncbi:Ig-like domain-containing protein [Planococcus sp. S3-L1]|uniref:Ig-like domain-containing protein n=1 Tax=Planococcus sp. S3-L1 TaxID=3046200 RepID=UPI0024BAD7C4|nr:Ig-like domain-containing protein [Planococcus sp. S3-L1]MDJ0331932.1 Ig-like domain-containing protein [Planococcus sp. S3-L1]